MGVRLVSGDTTYLIRVEQTKRPRRFERRGQGPPCCYDATAKRRPRAGHAEPIQVTLVLVRLKQTERPIHNSSSACGVIGR